MRTARRSGLNFARCGARSLRSQPSINECEPNERPFTIMPVAGHLLRILDVYPLKDGGKRT